MFVIRHNYACIGVRTSQNDVAAFLTIDGKSDSYEHVHEFPAGKVRRELH